jgi:hypothetical protein
MKGAEGLYKQCGDFKAVRNDSLLYCLKFGFWDFEFVWNLVLVIWDSTHNPNRSLTMAGKHNLSLPVTVLKNRDRS